MYVFTCTLTTPSCTCHLSHPSDIERSRSILESCVCAIERWMLHNNLKLNSEKTELLILHAKHRPAPPLDSMNIGDLVISSSNLT